MAEVRVIMADTDAMGIAYHATHLRWFEIGRTELIRRAGLPYTRMQELGFALPVVEVRCRYHAPAYYDDLLSLDVAVSKLARASVSFWYRAVRTADTKLICEGETSHACLDRQGKIRRFPEEILSSLVSAPRK